MNELFHKKRNSYEHKIGWSIDVSRLAVGSSMASDRFDLETDLLSNCYFRIQRGCNAFVSLYFETHDTVKRPVTLEVSFAYLDLMGSVISLTPKATKAYPSDKNSIEFLSCFEIPYGYYKKVTFRCNLIVMEGNLLSLGVSQLSKDFIQLFECLSFSDVILAVGEKEFAGHKNILSARSPVFAAMFEHDMTEKKLNRVEVTDIEEDVFYEVLRYIYTGSTDKLDELAFGLYAAADKYRLENLKHMCTHSMRVGISASTAIQTLLFANLYEDKDLKEYTMYYISDNVLDVLFTAEYKAASLDNPELIADLLAEVARKQREKELS